MPGSTIATTVSVGVTVGGGTDPSPLTITDAGTVAPSAYSAIGIYAPAGPATVSVINQGSISGGNGGSGVGGDGVEFLATASLTNMGTISGASTGPYGSPSAYGGVGVVLAAGGGIDNEGTIFGGTGGQYGGSAHLIPGVGGAGGDGVNMASGTLTNTGAIYGGTGGTGGNSLSGGFGGNGAAGVNLAGGSLTNSGTITGGAGGVNGGNVAGAGVDVGPGAAATNDATILGGQGGQGGFTPYPYGPAFSGAGAAGVYVNGGMLTNSGTITGGSGGSVVYVGAGEPGVIVNGGTLIDGGTISGGFGGGGGAEVDAVSFQGTTFGTLVLEPGAVFNGIVAGNGVGILDLPAGTSATTLTGLGTEYTGFTQLRISSGGNWTLPVSFTGGGGQPGVIVASGATLTASGGTIAVGGSGYGVAGAAAITFATNDSVANHGAIAGGTGGGGGASQSAGAGGPGIRIAATDSATNYGTISGGNGGADYASVNGGAGGDAVDLTGGTFTNSGDMRGGSGGHEAASGVSGIAANTAYGGFGVGLTAGASVVNHGTISGGFLGAGANVDGATLSNYLTLAGGYRGNGADLTSGASLTNDATITGGGGDGNGLVNNLLPAPVGNGVSLASGSTLTNNGTIAAGLGGAGALLNASVMLNDGVLTGGSGGDGASLTSGASMTNGGTITGGGGSPLAPSSHGASGAGVAMAAATTLTNDGTITGGEIADGVYLASGASLANLGVITGGTGLNPSTQTFGVHLTAGARATNLGTVAGGHGGGGAYLSGGTLLNSGYIEAGQYSPGVSLTGGTLITSGTIAGRAAYTITVPPHSGPGGSYPGGTYTIAALPAVQLGSLAASLVVDQGAVFNGPVAANTAAGDTLALSAGTAAGTLAGLGSSITGFATIAFDPGAAWTVEGSMPALGAGQDITGFTFGDTIDLQNELFGGSPTLEPSADALTISGNGNSVTLNIAGAGADAFAVTTDAATTGTDLSVQCFQQGTRIRTARGEVAVEALAIGDLVQTEFSGMAPVAWLGHRRVDCRRHPKPENVWPVRVLAGAFGDGQPHRNLWLSPDHAVFIDGVLIPIRYLVNGRTVAQQPRDAVTYWHVELGRHDMVLAEGLPCESYLDTGNRGGFANGGAAVQMHAEFALRVWEAEACAPLVVSGAGLEAARSWLLARAEALGHVLTRDAEIRVVADGDIVRCEVIGRTQRFRVPRGAGEVRIVSRSAVPAHVRDDSADHRRLGVAVSRVVCDGEVIPLTDPCFGSGWNDAESANGAIAWRWTDGDGRLVVPGGVVVDVEVVMTGRYWLGEAGVAGLNRRASAA